MNTIPLGMDVSLTVLDTEDSQRQQGLCSRLHATLCNSDSLLYFGGDIKFDVDRLCDERLQNRRLRRVSIHTFPYSGLKLFTVAFRTYPVCLSILQWLLQYSSHRMVGTVTLTSQFWMSNQKCYLIEQKSGCKSSNSCNTKLGSQIQTFVFLSKQ